jgi:hypothetical protein
MLRTGRETPNPGPTMPVKTMLLMRMGSPLGGAPTHGLGRPPRLPASTADSRPRPGTVRTHKNNVVHEYEWFEARSQGLNRNGLHPHRRPTMPMKTMLLMRMGLPLGGAPTHGLGRPPRLPASTVAAPATPCHAAWIVGATTGAGEGESRMDEAWEDPSAAAAAAAEQVGACGARSGGGGGMPAVRHSTLAISRCAHGRGGWRRGKGGGAHVARVDGSSSRRGVVGGGRRGPCLCLCLVDRWGPRLGLCLGRSWEGFGASRPRGPRASGRPRKGIGAPGCRGPRCRPGKRLLLSLCRQEPPGLDHLWRDGHSVMYRAREIGGPGRLASTSLA